MFPQKTIILALLILLSFSAVIFSREFSASARRGAGEMSRAAYMSDILRITNGVMPVLWIDPKYSYENNAKYFDLSGNANHGIQNTEANRPAVNPPGLEFDGVNDFVDCGSDESLNITDAITISAWVKFDDLSSRSYIFAKGLYKSDGWYWRVTENGSWFVAYNWAGTGDFPDSGIDLLTGEWLHLVTVLDNVAPRVDFYKNGEWLAYTNPSQSFIGNVDRTLLIGKSHDGYPHNGSIDEVRIYDRALSASQIQALYLAGLPRYR